MKSFRERVLEIVATIHRGETRTYKQVAAAAGSPNAARAVGTIMKSNYDPKIPCHRVVRSDGKPGEYNRGAENKIKILREEGAIK
ncbi:MAG: MGMT family protein [Candidatus Magasanikbacteria bacterium]|nr:MGMT family protein [Candidatus Magasanikbacteria bacterium]